MRYTIKLWQNNLIKDNAINGAQGVNKSFKMFMYTIIQYNSKNYLLLYTLLYT